MKKIINKFPDKFKWTIHNIVAHLLSEIFYLLGLQNISDIIHDSTIPDHEKGQERG
jgi:hypothetical protein